MKSYSAFEDFHIRTNLITI